MRANRRAALTDGPTLREGLAVLGGGYLLAIVMHWPLVLHLRTDVAKDIGDPMAQAWQLAWDGHVLRTFMLDPWQANIFWPNHDTLAFSDSLLGYAPFGIFSGGPGGALVQYNLVFFFSYAAALTGAYVLARTLGLERFPSLVAGLAYAWAPWRWEQSIHLQVLSSGAIPLAIALLISGYRRKEPRHVYWGWIVVAWQLFIGPSLALLLIYLIIALVGVGIVLWLRAGRPRPAPGVVIATFGGLLILGCSAAYVGVPYLRVQDEHPQAKRSLGEIAAFSPPLNTFLASSENNTIWGGITAPARNSLRSPTEQTLFPGLTIVVLAVVGLCGGNAFSRRLRIGLLVMTLLCALFSLGLTVDGGRFTYRLLYDFVPGWQGSRTPGRLTTLTSLSLALLGAAGAQAVTDAIARSALRRRELVAGVAAMAIAAAVLLEGSAFRTNGSLAFPPHPSVPRRPPALAGLRGPILELPSPGSEDKSYELWSTDGFPQLVNGGSSILPQNTLNIIGDAKGFPDAGSVRFLRELGVRTVVVHRNLAAGTPWADAATRSLAGLDITRRLSADTVIFDIPKPSLTAIAFRRWRT